jgi:hypothetical protein
MPRPRKDINLMYVRAQLAQGRPQKAIAAELGVDPSTLSDHLTKYGQPPPLAGQTGTGPLEGHPLADLFPLIEGPEFEELVADIATQGLLEPLTLYEGKILDGRNRYRACQRLGKPYTYIEYSGNEPLNHVISLNVRRRQMTKGQLAMCAAKLANIRAGDFVENQYVASANLQTPRISQAEAAAMFGVSVRSVAHAQTVRTRGTPELLAAVEEDLLAVYSMSSASGSTGSSGRPRQGRGSDTPARGVNRDARGCRAARGAASRMRRS